MPYRTPKGKLPRWLENLKLDETADIVDIVKRLEVLETVSDNQNSQIKQLKKKALDILAKKHEEKKPK